MIWNCTDDAELMNGLEYRSSQVQICHVILRKRREIRSRYKLMKWIKARLKKTLQTVKNFIVIRQFYTNLIKEANWKMKNTTDIHIRPWFFFFTKAACLNTSFTSQLRMWYASSSIPTHCSTRQNLNSNFGEYPLHGVKYTILKMPQKVSLKSFFGK